MMHAVAGLSNISWKLVANEIVHGLKAFGWRGMLVFDLKSIFEIWENYEWEILFDRMFWKEFQRNFKIKLGGNYVGRRYLKRWMDELIGSCWRTCSTLWLWYKRHFVVQCPLRWTRFTTFIEKGPSVNIGSSVTRSGTQGTKKLLP